MWIKASVDEEIGETTLCDYRWCEISTQQYIMRASFCNALLVNWHQLLIEYLSKHAGTLNGFPHEYHLSRITTSWLMVAYIKSIRVLKGS